MRRIFITLFAIFLSLQLRAQPNIDSLYLQLSSVTSDTAKSRVMINIGAAYLHTQPDSAFLYAFNALKLGEKEGYRYAQINGRRLVAMVIGFSGNYVKALQFLMEAKALAEEDKNFHALSNINHVTGNLYRWQKDYIKAAHPYQLAMNYTDTRPVETSGSYLTESNLSEVYMELGKLDSALMYGQRAYEHILQSKSKSSFYGVLSRLGLIHQKLGNPSLGRQFLQMAADKVMHTDEVRNKCFFLFDLSKFFKNAGNVDSSIYYARTILHLPGSHIFKPQLLDATELLAELFTDRNTDSAFKYLKLSTALKEELLGQEQQQQLLTIRFEDEVRQQQLTAARLQSEKSRKQNLQYAAIALGIVMFLILFFLLSHSIIANQRVIKFLGILSLLIVFEFINLFIHPYLDKWTNHSIPMMLLVMVCIAALLIPLHHRLEHFITTKLVEKNNKIRLAAAKKVIQKLEVEHEVTT